MAILVKEFVPVGLLVLGLAPACDGCGEWLIPERAVWRVGFGESVPAVA
jgi:hypothetical protein